MKITREQLKGIVREVMTEESEYQTFFKKALEKTGKSIPDMSDEEKKDFFNKIDSAWNAKGEKNEGNAFGAAVTKAKEEGDDEFTVDGKTYPVKESVNESFENPLEGLPQQYKDLLKKLQRSNVPSVRSKLIDKMNVIRKGLKLKPLTNDYKESVNEASRYLAKKDAEHLIHYLSGKQSKDVLSFIFKVYNFKSDKAKKEMAQAFVKYQNGVLDKKGLETAFFDIDKKYGMRESVNEALLPADTKVVSAFFDKKPLDGRNLNTNGKVLKTAGIGSQEMYIHTPKGVKMVGKITGKYAQSLVQFVNKNYKTDLVESINEYFNGYVSSTDGKTFTLYNSDKKKIKDVSFDELKNKYMKTYLGQNLKDFKDNFDKTTSKGKYFQWWLEKV